MPSKVPKCEKCFKLCIYQFSILLFQMRSIPLPNSLPHSHSLASPVFFGLTCLKILTLSLVLFCFIWYSSSLLIKFSFWIASASRRGRGAVVSNLGHSISILCWNHKSLKMKAKAKTHAYISWLVGCHILIQNRAVGGRGGDSCDIFLSNFRVDILIIMIKNYICGFLIINNTRPSKLYLCQLIQHEDTTNLEVLP